MCVCVCVCVCVGHVSVRSYKTSWKQRTNIPESFRVFWGRTCARFTPQTSTAIFTPFHCFIQQSQFRFRGTRRLSVAAASYLSLHSTTDILYCSNTCLTYINDLRMTGLLQTQRGRHQSHSGESGGDLNLPADVGSVTGGAYEVSAAVSFCLLQMYSVK